eukprot:TRINITY_DN7168_c0_g1_i1.p1 TRINITY_DN7168_c0_g1~~TRINITY_DN7168_c0_g1_i1.p1  ORF type:complete len:1153 (-),score=253.99 TRINITY_DN7168_c0_g1_i1:369-3827(-)
MKRLSTLLCATIFALCAITIHAQIRGCGGFISASTAITRSLKTKADFSLLEVRLVALDGKAKASTSPAPNGYYFLPVEEKGRFVMKVKAPLGWTFEPQEQPIVIATDGTCEDGNDINFKLTGFSVSGKVEVMGVEENQASHPAESDKLVVSLVPENPTASSKSARQAATPGVPFVFTNTESGVYYLTVSHPTWSFVNREMKVTVSWGNVDAAESFVVSGFRVSGFVLVDGHPIKDVRIHLVGSGKPTIPCSDALTGGSGSSESCVTHSDSNGEFFFQGLPAGQYTLSPSYVQDNAVYSITPSDASVLVSYGDVVLSEAFKVVGFSVNGRVLDPAGQPIPNVQILFNGIHLATTDDLGSYAVPKMQAGVYTIKAARQHYSFGVIDKYSLSTKTATIPSIQPIGFDVCGRVMIDQHFTASIKRKRPVLIQSKTENVQRVLTDETGAYCVSLPIGTYEVSTPVTQAESKAGLLLNPASISVTVSDKPVGEIDFAQTRVIIQGSVQCLDPQCSDKPQVELVNTETNVVDTVSLSLQAEKAATFTFKNVLPGNYLVTLKHANWCISKDVQQVAVSSESLILAPFVQEGFSVPISTSHPSVLEVSSEDGYFRDSRQSDKKTTSICVPKPGAYTVSAKSCVQFAENTLKYDTSRPGHLSFEASSVSMEVQLQTQGIVDPSIKLHIRTEGSVKALDVDSVQDSVGYVYKTVVSKGAYEIIPSSDTLVFSPKTVAFEVSTFNCGDASTIKFTGRPGIFIKGTVLPGIADVRIIVYDANDRIVQQTLSDTSGHYAIGPLEDINDYVVKAFKDGVVFTKTTGNDFRALQLSSLSVKVEDESRSPLGGVLLSLSSDGFRSNNITSKDGALTFTNLHPGSYYLRIMLKEYQFEPSAMSFDIEEGASEALHVVGRRFAFSCYGSVRTITGEPLSEVAVEAVSEDFVESTTSDKYGNYRIRGLLPTQQYQIRVSPDAGIRRSSPSEVVFVAGDSDVYNVDFLVFTAQSHFDVTGVVLGVNNDSKAIEVELIDHATLSKLKSVSLDMSPIFSLGPQAPGEYIIRVQTSSKSTEFESNMVEIPISVGEESTHFNIPFTVVPRKTTTQITRSPLYSLIIGITIIVATFYKEKTLQLLQTAKSFVQAALDAKNPSVAAQKRPKKSTTAPRS